MQKIVIYLFFFLVSILVCAALFGKEIARTYPNALTYFSFNDGLMRWKYEYGTGVVGDFTIGEDEHASLSRLKTCMCYYVYPVSGGKPRERVAATTDLAEYRQADGSLILTKHSEAGVVGYQLHFSHLKLVGVSAYSSIFAGL